MLIFSSLEQLKNKPLVIVLRFGGKLISINDEQLQNAYSIILTTESGIVTFFKFLQLTKDERLFHQVMNIRQKPFYQPLL